MEEIPENYKLTRREKSGFYIEDIKLGVYSAAPSLRASAKISPKSVNEIIFILLPFSASTRPFISRRETIRLNLFLPLVVEH